MWSDILQRHNNVSEIVTQKQLFVFGVFVAWTFKVRLEKWSEALVLVTSQTLFYSDLDQMFPNNVLITSPHRTGGILEGFLEQNCSWMALFSSCHRIIIDLRSGVTLTILSEFCILTCCRWRFPVTSPNSYKASDDWWLPWTLNFKVLMHCCM